MRVLLVEDDRELADYVRRGLEEEGHSVQACFDGSSGLRAAERSAFDIIVLDVMLPFVDGLEVTRRLRRGGVRTPVLLLTACDAPEDIVRGLDAGADDYLTKPFAFDVLLARLRARTRAAAPADARRRFADLTIDLERNEAWRDNAALRLSRTEFSILECLMRSAGRIVTRGQLIEAVWGDREVSSNNLDVFIHFLRLKVDLPGYRRLIHTERGVGYSLRDTEC
jgi:DNA-binding response OmpR family regulator